MVNRLVIKVEDLICTQIRIGLGLGLGPGLILLANLSLTVFNILFSLTYPPAPY